MSLFALKNEHMVLAQNLFGKLYIRQTILTSILYTVNAANAFLHVQQQNKLYPTIRHATIKISVVSVTGRNNRVTMPQLYENNISP